MIQRQVYLCKRCLTNCRLLFFFHKSSVYCDVMSLITEFYTCLYVCILLYCWHGCFFCGVFDESVLLLLLVSLLPDFIFRFFNILYYVYFTNSLSPDFITLKKLLRFFCVICIDCIQMVFSFWWIFEIKQLLQFPNEFP